MTDEGVIQYTLDYRETETSAFQGEGELSAWRNNLWKLELIGQHPEKYEGYGYGNVSQRAKGNQFYITGTQTGHLKDIHLNHYALIEVCTPDSNHVIASGACKPSSEAMTHAMIYAQDSTIQAVLHAHSHDIWASAARLDIPTTDVEVEYGTPEMADEVARLFKETDVLQKRILSMAGHLDGVITFGNTPQEAGMVMLRALAKAQP